LTIAVKSIAPQTYHQTFLLKVILFFAGQ